MVVYAESHRLKDGLNLTLLLWGPLAYKIFRDLCAICESEGNSRKQHERVPISILTHCYTLFIALQSLVEDQATATDKLVCISTAKFLPSLTSFTPSFRFCFGRVSSMLSTWTSSYTKTDSSKSFMKYY